MASLAAATVVHEGLYAADKVSGVSFGQPRVGDEAFAKAHTSLVRLKHLILTWTKKSPKKAQTEVKWILYFDSQFARLLLEPQLLLSMSLRAATATVMPHKFCYFIPCRVKI
jgi:hypothetical protein